MGAPRYLIWLFFLFGGRLGRWPYLAGVLSMMLIIGTILLLFEDPEIMDQKQWTPLLGWSALVLVWSLAALLVKRSRDLGMSWPWVLLLAVPMIQLLVVFGFAIPKSASPSANGG